MTRTTSDFRTVRRLLAHWVAGLALISGAGVAFADILTVGQGGAFATIAEAAKKAKTGDTVIIRPGEYHGDVAVWPQKNLTIVGGNPRPVVIADGESAEGKATWVIKNGDVTIENIEFRGSRVADGNGAGIRFERGRLIVRNSVFTDNQNGILTANDEDAELSIENCAFTSAPAQAHSLPHLLYVGRIARVEIVGSRFHNGHIGHLIKSRARETILRYNLIFDGPGGKASYEVDLPNGGDALLIGNIIGQNDDTDNPVVIAYGAEGGIWPNNRLRLSHNTLTTNRLSGTWFLRVWEDRIPGEVEVLGVNNLTVGLGLFTLTAPGTFTGNWPLLPGALDDDILDFNLSADSFLRGWVDPLDPDDPMRPTAEFSLPIGTRPLPTIGEWAPGAMQSGTY